MSPDWTSLDILTILLLIQRRMLSGYTAAYKKTRMMCSHTTCISLFAFECYIKAIQILKTMYQRVL